MLPNVNKKVFEIARWKIVWSMLENQQSFDVGKTGKITSRGGWLSYWVSFWRHFRDIYDFRFSFPGIYGGTTFSCPTVLACSFWEKNNRQNCNKIECNHDYLKTSGSYLGTWTIFYVNSIEIKRQLHSRVASWGMEPCRMWICKRIVGSPISLPNPRFEVLVWS